MNREYVVECFFHKHPVLKELVVVKFEPYGQDTVSGLSRDHGAEIFLDKDARKWATKLTKDQQTIATFQKQVKGLQSVTSAYTKVTQPCFDGFQIFFHFWKFMCKFTVSIYYSRGASQSSPLLSILRVKARPLDDLHHPSIIILIRMYTFFYRLPSLAPVMLRLRPNSRLTQS